MKAGAKFSGRGQEVQSGALGEAQIEQGRLEGPAPPRISRAWTLLTASTARCPSTSSDIRSVANRDASSSITRMFIIALVMLGPRDGPFCGRALRAGVVATKIRTVPSNHILHSARRIVQSAISRTTWEDGRSSQPLSSSPLVSFGLFRSRCASERSADSMPLGVATPGNGEGRTGHVHACRE